MEFVLPASWHQTFYPRRGGAPLAYRALPASGTHEGRVDADSWIAADGPAAAALTATAFAATDPSSPIVRRRLLSRVRIALAAAPLSVYAAALDDLRKARTESLGHRLAAAFLAPTETDWVERDLADLPDRHPLAPLLLASVSTVDQVLALLDRLAPTQAEQLQEPDILHTLAEGIGDGILDLYARHWTGRSIEYTMAGVPEYLAAMLEALPSIPTDRAFQTLLDQAGERGVAAAVMQAADRFPALAMRLLRANASRPMVADLLRRHAAKHPELAPPGLRPTGSAPGPRRPGPGPADSPAALLPLPPLPHKSPRLPSWAEPGTLPPVAVRGGGGVLPADAIEHLARLLMLGSEVTAARADCDGYDLARLGWELLCRWESAGAPPAGAWALRAQALVGDDLTAAGLAGAARRWAREGAHRRAAATLDVLSNLGTEAALRHLHELASTARSRAVGSRAEAALHEVARGLGLTTETLADRLVPRLGLAPDATMLLDYGPRRFTAGFDEQLRPYVTDEHGIRRKDLPAPTTRDDPTRAAEARSHFTATKRAVRKLAAEQIRRLESAMVHGRRWEAPELRTALLDHPLLWLLARRLVWLTGPPGSPGTALRIAEDRTFATVTDDPFTLPPATVLGIAHPADLDVPAWTRLFADYGLLQPFEQLHRRVYHLTPAESAAVNLPRFANRPASAVKLLALESRGWCRPATARSRQTRLERALPDGRHLVVDLDPGITLGLRPDHQPDQRLSSIRIRTPGNATGPVPFATLDAASTSELLADLESCT